MASVNCILVDGGVEKHCMLLNTFLSSSHPSVVRLSELFALSRKGKCQNRNVQSGLGEIDLSIIRLVWMKGDERHSHSGRLTAGSKRCTHNPGGYQNPCNRTVRNPALVPGRL